MSDVDTTPVEEYQILVKISAEGLTFETELGVEDVVFWLDMLKFRILAGLSEPVE